MEESSLTMVQLFRKCICSRMGWFCQQSEVGVSKTREGGVAFRSPTALGHSHVSFNFSFASGQKVQGLIGGIVIVGLGD